MARTVSRSEFDALTARVDALEKRPSGATGPGGSTGVTGPTGSTGAPAPVTGPTGAPPSDAVLSAPDVVIEGTTYTLDGTITTNKAMSFVYLQLAVRGPNASDLAFSPGTKMNPGTTKHLHATGAGVGDFQAWVAYSLDGTTWVDGPKTEFRVTRPVSAASVGGITAVAPQAKFSGLPFTSLVFRQTPSDAEEFGRRRGIPMDGLLYFTPRQEWEHFRKIPAGQADWLATGKTIVTSMPHAPESEGDQMNQRGANDAYRQNQRDLGKWFTDNGFNVPNHVIRVDWECNGNWYKWSANRPGGPDALRQALINYVTNMRAGGLTKVKFDLCFNKGPSQAGADYGIFPGSEYIDVIGIDQYDMWAPSYSQADWDREMAKGPSMRINAEFARKNGILWSLDEGGNTHGDQNQGGDNPSYWDFVFAEIARSPENFAWHNTYDDPGAPSSLMHDFARNPKAWARYLQLLQQQRK